MQKEIKISKEKLEKILIIVAIILVIICVLAIIPTTRKFFINLYNTNAVVNVIVNIFRDTFSKGF